LAYPKLTDQPGALELAAAIRAGDITPHEAIEDAIARIEHLDVHVNAVAVCDFERAIETAKAMDGQTPRDDQPLFGVPMTIKESFDIRGLPTCWGHKAHAENIAQRNAKVVSRLKAAGVVFLGKTNVPVDLSDWQSFNEVYGRTNNPHDHDRSPGGSSGGSAAAVASGMVPIEYGTDIGGSVRVPAHFCGVWGHKTSWGLVPKHGHDHPLMAGKDAHDGALSIAGPLARNADDIEIVLRLTAEFPLFERKKPLKECRVLALLDHPDSPLDNSVRGPIEAALAALESAGVHIDHSSDLVPDLAAQQADYLRMLNIAMARGMPTPDGKRATATDWFDLLDSQARNELAWEQVFEAYDFVLAPPAPVLAVPHRGEAVFRGDLDINGEAHPASGGLAWAGLATFPNLPATVLPIGSASYLDSTLPCGLQVMGGRWRDLDCIAAARDIDRIVNG
jgi:amidase